MTFPSLNKFDQFSVGFDRMFKEFNNLADTFTKNIPSYPPYNIRKVDDNKYVIEIAVAGFGESDINIEIDGDTLRVTGDTKSTEDANADFLYRGIAGRAFTRTFALADKVEVKNAEMINGMLRIWLERFAELNKVRKVEINKGATTGKQVLNEKAGK